MGQCYRQQRNLPAAERTIPDLVLYLNGKPLLSDVTVVDPMADTNLAEAVLGSGRAVEAAAARKVAKYAATAEAMVAVHLPFAVETTGGLSESAQQLIREIHHSAGQHCTWREAESIGSHLVDSIAIAVQRCTGMALQANIQQERRIAMGRW